MSDATYRRVLIGSCRVFIGVAAVVAATASGGCGANTAEARAAEESELIDWARSLSERSEARQSTSAAAAEMATSGRTLDGAGEAEASIVVTRSSTFAARYDVPPADSMMAAELSPEEVVLSFAMYTTARRWADQWALLSPDTQATFVRGVRDRAERIGTADARAALAESSPEELWTRGAEIRIQPPGLDVRWRITAGVSEATVEAWRDDQRIDRVPLVRDAGTWRLDLRDRIGGSADD